MLEYGPVHIAQTDDACIISLTINGTSYGGTSKRHPHDQPDLETGELLALSRALHEAAVDTAKQAEVRIRAASRHKRIVKDVIQEFWAGMKVIRGPKPAKPLPVRCSWKNINNGKRCYRPLHNHEPNAHDFNDSMVDAKSEVAWLKIEEQRVKRGLA